MLKETETNYVLLFWFLSLEAFQLEGGWGGFAPAPGYAYDEVGS